MKEGGKEGGEVGELDNRIKKLKSEIDNIVPSCIQVFNFSFDY